ncbi:carboxypeptidase regulatory-like domain-containing protein, partial [Candidatus Roizmanbacteria bacterium]|nr:carboxypeptidase regulatory-like domain-containing protein [Candidatus Roizmanbacteria bacterium]
MPAQKNKDDPINQKIPTEKDVPFFEKLRAIKKKWLFIAGGVLLLLLVGIMANTSSKTSSDNFLPSEPPEGESIVSGIISDEQGNPVDGARVVSKNHMVATAPDGSFAIPAENDENLTVSAFGYESTTVSASNPDVRLTTLAGGTVRISVIDTDRNPLEDSLVVRLDPNTGAPVSEAITDQYGSVFFADIPSGQAAFIVLRPGYGFGWTELAVAPSSTEQHVIVLPEISEGKELSSSSDWWPIKPIYAQERDGLSWSVDKDSDTSSYIQVIRDN